MTVVTGSLFAFDNTFVRDLVGLYEPWQPAPAPQPELLLLNDDLAGELGVDPQQLRAPDGVAVLAGNAVPAGAEPVAQAYAGHQFGGYSPRLGDGRALLLGEIIDRDGRRRDLHLKGSGRTPFARGGDGKAAVGPMVREYVIGEAMHHLGIPTTRALAVVATGERIARDTWLPGAVLTRVASSHLRVGSFQYASASGDADLLGRLVHHAIVRHHPQAADAADPALALLDAVVGVQADLVARWMLVGFIHGVMNTDNMTISGETIDYGPCAFMDRYDPATVFSSIDHGGRYAYGNQPQIALWNLSRLAEALLPAMHGGTDAAVAAATEVLQSFPARFHAVYDAGMRAKIGLGDEREGDAALVGDLLGLMQRQGLDWTGLFRSLSWAVRGDRLPARWQCSEPDEFDAWADRWLARVVGEPVVVAAAMDAVNPVYIARNHLVEEALTAATEGDLQPVRRLVDVLAAPFVEVNGQERYAVPAPDGSGPHVTYCGT